MVKKIFFLIISINSILFAQNDNCNCEFKNNNVNDYKDFMHDYFNVKYNDSLKYHKIRVEKFKKICGENNYKYAESMYKILALEWGLLMSRDTHIETKSLNIFSESNLVYGYIKIRKTFKNELVHIIKVFKKCNSPESKMHIFLAESILAKYYFLTDLGQIEESNEPFVNNDYMTENQLCLKRQNIWKTNKKEIPYYEEDIFASLDGNYLYNANYLIKDLMFATEYHLFKGNYNKAKKSINLLLKVEQAKQYNCSSFQENCFKSNKEYMQLGNLYFSYQDNFYNEDVMNFCFFLKKYGLDYCANYLLISRLYYDKKSYVRIISNFPVLVKDFDRNITFGIADSLANKKTKLDFEEWQFINIVFNYIEKEAATNIVYMNNNTLQWYVQKEKLYNKAIEDGEKQLSDDKSYKKFLIEQKSLSFNKSFLDSLSNINEPAYDSLGINYDPLKVRVNTMLDSLNHDGRFLIHSENEEFELTNDVRIALAQVFLMAELRKEARKIMSEIEYDYSNGPLHEKNLLIKSINVLSNKDEKHFGYEIDGFTALQIDYLTKVNLNSMFEYGDALLNSNHKLELVRTNIWQLLTFKVHELKWIYETNWVQKSINNDFNKAYIWTNISSKLTKNNGELEISIRDKRKNILEKLRFQKENDYYLSNNLEMQEYLNLSPDSLRPIQVEDIQKELNDDEALIMVENHQKTGEALVWDNNRGYDFIIIRKERETHVLSSTPLLKNFHKTDSLSFVNNYESQDWNANILKKLFDLTSNTTKVKKIYYTTSGAYNNILLPFLRDSTGKRLNETFQFQKIESVDELLNPNPNNETVKASSISIFANPEYYPDTLQWINKAREITQNTRYLIKFDSTVSYQRWSQTPFLPGTRIEAMQIDSIFSKQGIKANMYLGIDAMEENFYEQEKIKPEIIHIATHGSILKNDNDNDWEKVNNSIEYYNRFESNAMLCMTGFDWGAKNNYYTFGNGMLDANEIKKMDLSDTKLVVLSACESALGESGAIDGVYGLPRAFKNAGVKYVLSSLWNVNDKKAPEFMKIFYEKLAKGIPIKQSFYETQETMANTYPKEPYLWAGFQLY